MPKSYNHVPNRSSVRELDAFKVWWEGSTKTGHSKAFSYDLDPNAHHDEDREAGNFKQEKSPCREGEDERNRVCTQDWDEEHREGREDDLKAWR